MGPMYRQQADILTRELGDAITGTTLACALSIDGYKDGKQVAHKTLKFTTRNSVMGRHAMAQAEA